MSTYSSPEALVRGADKIASPPKVFHKINEIVNDPNSTTDEIARYISGDAGLTMRLLRIVNSAFFGYTQKIESLDQAVLALGTSQVRDLVLATTVAEKFDGIPPDLFNMELFWEHSLACGVMARSLASARKEIHLEPFFLGGMLHDVGRLLMFARIPREYGKVVVRCQQSDEPWQFAERELFGFDHADVGGCLLKAWGLPPHLEEAVACHHLPQKAVRNPMLSSVVHIADVVVNALKLGNSGSQVVPKLSAFAWSRFGMAAHILSQAVDQTELQYRAILKALEIRDDG